jgi:3'(2'), 5'-bisphosphate nucleotidase
MGLLYFGGESLGSYRIQTDSDSSHHLTEQPLTWDQLISQGKKLPLDRGQRPYRVVASRSHMSDETAAFIEQLREEHKEVELISKGSSLKICLVAEGTADVYPRFAPTMEWDTAAGHAVASGAGKSLSRTVDRISMQYNREDLLNPWFIVE